jgi:hypothetical protein
VSGELLDGYATSVDGELIVTITGYTENPEVLFTNRGDVSPPRQHTFMNVIDGRTGSSARRFELAFPEGEPRWIRPLLSPILTDSCVLSLTGESPSANGASRSDIARQNEDSGYGLIRNNDGSARFGLYSIGDGRRLTTIPGDVFHYGVFRGAISENVIASIAPIEGFLMFTPDSRTLFGASEHVWQWDVSSLR